MGEGVKYAGGGECEYVAWIKSLNIFAKYIQEYPRTQSSKLKQKRLGLINVVECKDRGYIICTVLSV